MTDDSAVDEETSHEGSDGDNGRENGTGSGSATASSSTAASNPTVGGAASDMGWYHTHREGNDPDESVVLVCLSPGQNREMLTGWLSEWVAVEVASSLAALDGDGDDVDLCLVDIGRLEASRDALASYRESSAPVFFPIIALDTRRSGEPPAWVWEFADGVVTAPVRKPALRNRLETLLSRRRDTVALAEREAELAAALEAIDIEEQAMNQAPIGISITGPQTADAPLEHVNDAFCELTDYEREDILGRNCRFLQGPDTHAETVAALRAAIDDERPIQVDILNYTKQGGQFWNNLTVAPVGADIDGRPTQFVGFQMDITARKVDEQRLQVKDRLLRHNLRNDMNIVDGFAQRIAETESLSPAGRDAVERIRRTTDRLSELSEEIRRVEAVLDAHHGDNAPVTVDDVCATIRGKLGESVALDVEPGLGSASVSGRELATACVETVRVLDTGEAAPTPVDVGLRRDGAGVELTFTVADTTVPAAELDVLESGQETTLDHPDRVGVWLARWALQLARGDIRVEPEDAEAGRGLRVRLWVPTVDADPDG